jgi:prepilin-type N-terminal cleavage/methylation domain-containing protein
MICAYTATMLKQLRNLLCSHRAGFSLVELTIVVAILGVVTAFGLEAAANFVNRNAGTVTKERLAVVDQSVQQFFRIYGRLPCPSVISLAPTPPSNYGLEDCNPPAAPGGNYPNGTQILTGTTIGGGVMVGAVPFRTLNLSATYALDAFNNRLEYLVTKNLTVAGGSATVNNRFASSGGTAAQNGIAGIEIRTGRLDQPCDAASTICQKLADPAATPPNGAAYAILSHGGDKRGARSLRGAAQSICLPVVASFNMRPDSQNCVMGSNAIQTNIQTFINPDPVIPHNVFYDNRYNAGLNLTSYFDDYIVWRTKAQL